MLIYHGVPPLGGVKQGSVGKTSYFRAKMRQYLENGWRYEMIWRHKSSKHDVAILLSVLVYDLFIAFCASVYKGRLDDTRQLLE